MKIWPKQQYLKEELKGSCNYFKFRGIFIDKQNRIHTLQDIIVVKDSIPTKIIKGFWNKHNNPLNESYENVTKEEWDELYERLYNNFRKKLKDSKYFIRSFGDSDNFSRYYKIKKINKYTVELDEILRIWKVYRLFENVIIDISELFHELSLDKITEEEWSEAYEKIQRT